MTDTELLAFVESLEIMLPDTYAEHLAALKSRLRSSAVPNKTNSPGPRPPERDPGVKF